MSDEDPKKDNPGHVTAAQCMERMGEFAKGIEASHGDVRTMKASLEKVEMAMWGGEGRGGLVRDVTLLLQRSRWAGAIVSAVVGIFASAIATYIFHVLAA